MSLRFPHFFIFLLLTSHAAECCTIPVFRYALDRWEADRFHLTLPSSVSKDPALQDLLRPLRANGKANLEISTSRDEKQTHAVLHGSREGEPPLWEGNLDKTTLTSLLNSPARQKIIQQVLAGDSIIWVIANSGSPLDTAEAERVEKRLKFLEQVASLPIQDPNDPDSQLGPGPPLRLKFTVLRINRDDPAENLLLRMLASPTSEIDPSKTNFAAAVFGRGRVLGAWPLEMLDDRTLEEVSMFLVGRCSCRLKNENPGWDVLLDVDWEKALKATSSSTPTRVVASAPAEQAAKPVPEVVTVTAEGPPDQKWAVKELLVGGVFVGAVMMVLIWLKSRKNGRQ